MQSDAALLDRAIERGWGGRTAILGPGGVRWSYAELLAHANRRRLDFECMRDAMLATTGGLDAAIGGRPVPLSEPPFTGRRTLYGFIDRLNLHFKVGIHCGVEIPFTAQELAIVNRIAAATTFDQVERLAAEVYEMEKQQKRDQQDEQGNGNAGGEGEEGEESKQQSKGNKSDAQDNKDKKKSDKSETREAGNEDKSQQGQESDDQDGEHDQSDLHGKTSS